MKFKLGMLAGTFLILTFFVYRQYSKTDVTLDMKNRNEKINQLENELQIASVKVKMAQGHSHCERDNQCRVVGLGAASCGFEKSFIIYSTLDSKEAELLTAVNEFNTAHKKMVDLTLAATACGSKPVDIRCVHTVCTPTR